MKNSGRLPLFVQVPFHASLNDWFISMKSNELYSVHAFKFDAEVFPLLLEARPCLILTSILDENSKIDCLQFLHEFKKFRLRQGYPSRDPSLRIVVIAKNRQAASTNWPDLGVYELMIAPVPTNVLMYKLSRHHQKAMTAETPKASVQPIEEIPLKEIFPSEPAPRLETWRSYGVIPENVNARAQSTLTAERVAGSERTFRKIEVEVRMQDLDPAEGEWVPAEESLSVERKWDWKPKSNPSTQALKAMTPVAATFWGEKPTFHPAKKTWQFAGEQPRLEKKIESTLGLQPILQTESSTSHQRPTLRAHPSLEVQSAKQKLFLEPTENTETENSVGREAVSKKSESAASSLKEISSSPNTRTSINSSAAPPRSESRESSTKTLAASARTEAPQGSRELSPEMALARKGLSNLSQKEDANGPLALKPLKESAARKPNDPESSDDFKAESLKGGKLPKLDPLLAMPSSSSQSLSSLADSNRLSKDSSHAMADLKTHAQKEGAVPALSASTPRSESEMNRSSTSLRMDASSNLFAPNVDSVTEDESRAGISVQLPEEGLAAESLEGAAPSRLSSEASGPNLETLHGQREYEKGFPITQSGHESYSSTTIRSDEEESFWSILYDDEEGKGSSSKEQKKENVIDELEGWTLTRIQKDMPKQVWVSREGQSQPLQVRMPKQSLFERILRFIRQFFGLQTR